jgi:hypothetical protein
MLKCLASSVISAIDKGENTEQSRTQRVLVCEITSPGKTLDGVYSDLWRLMLWWFRCCLNTSKWVCNGLVKHSRAVSTWSELVILNSPMSTMSLKKFLLKCTTSFFNTLQNISIRWFAVERPTRKLLSPDTLSPWWSLNNRCASRITIFSVPASLRMILGKEFGSIIWSN